MRIPSWWFVDLLLDFRFVRLLFVCFWKGGGSLKKNVLHIVNKN